MIRKNIDLIPCVCLCYCERVVPHVGAWIETRRWPQKTQGLYVVPHVGAWIETSDTHSYRHLHSVVPHVGARIETGVKSS